MMDRRTLLSKIDETVGRFLYEDRLEDTEIGKGDIEYAIRMKHIPRDLIIKRFVNQLDSLLPFPEDDR